MSGVPSHRIPEQNEAYRKGLVLGLTMAEVGILIIFVLLLLLVVTDSQRIQIIQRSEGKVLVTPLELAQLNTARTTLQAIAQEMGTSIPDSSEDFIELVRVVHETMQQPATRSSLSQATSELEKIENARAELMRVAKEAGAGESL